MSEVAERGEHVVAHEQECQRTAWRGHPDEPDSLGAGVVELDGEDREIMLPAQPVQHPPMTATDGVVRDDLVIEHGDTHDGIVSAPSPWQLQHIAYRHSSIPSKHRFTPSLGRACGTGDYPVVAATRGRRARVRASLATGGRERWNAEGHVDDAHRFFSRCLASELQAPLDRAGIRLLDHSPDIHWEPSPRL